jgi:hypothetical protein
MIIKKWKDAIKTEYSYRKKMRVPVNKNEKGIKDLKDCKQNIEK